MQVTANGLVIKEKVLSNDNRLLTILTEEYGIVHAFVKSVKKLGGTMAASTDLFACSSFVLFLNKEQYSVNHAETNRIFYHLRDDLEQTSLASYFSQLAEELAPQGEEAGEYLKLFLNCLHLLEQKKRTVDFIKPVFELPKGSVFSSGNRYADLFRLFGRRSSQGRDSSHQGAVGSDASHYLFGICPPVSV